MRMVMACPAATEVHPATDAPSVICGVLALSNDRAHVAGFQSRGQLDPVMSGSKDASTVQNFCAGRGVPGSLASYCRCVLWRAEKDRIAAGRSGPDALRDEQAVRPPATRALID